MLLPWILILGWVWIIMLCKGVSSLSVRGTLTIITFESSTTTTTTSEILPLIQGSPQASSTVTTETLFSTGLSTWLVDTTSLPTFNTALLPSRTDTPSPTRSITEIFSTVSSAIVIDVTTNSLGQLITSTTTSRIISLPSTSSTATSTSASSSSTSTSSAVSSTVASTSSAPSPSATARPSKTLTKAQYIPLIVVLGLIAVLVCLWLIRRYIKKRSLHLSRPEEETPFWVHPIHHTLHGLRLLRVKTPINDFRFTRGGSRMPRISSPYPNLASVPERPSRPTSLTPSLMEDLRTMPQPRGSKNKPVIRSEGPNHTRGDSPSPPPLKIYKSQPILSPFGPDLERNARVSPVDYTFDDSSTREPSIIKPRRSLYRNPEIARYRLGPNGPYLPEPIGSVEEQDQHIIDDPPVRHMHQAEALRRLEEGQGSAMEAAQESDDDEVKSEGSYDFAAARAQKLLADTRKRGL